MHSTSRLLPALLAGAFAFGSFAATSEEPEFTETGLQVVGVDDQGDWGQNAGSQDASGVGEAQGQDLVGAAVGLDPEDPTQLLFELTVSQLPAPGGMPEATRYTWDFKVGKDTAQLDGKFTNYSRGACDHSSGACPPPRDPGSAPFSLRGNCLEDDAGVTSCEELALYHATFDAAAGTITVAVPLEDIGAVECSVIQGAGNLFGGSISATPSAYFTVNYMPMDVMIVDGRYEIPMADGTPCPVVE